jgi:hypothetical protein
LSKGGLMELSVDAHVYASATSKRIKKSALPKGKSLAVRVVYVRHVSR